MSTTLKEEKVRKKREQQDQTKRKEKEDVEEWIRERRKEKKKRERVEKRRMGWVEGREESRGRQEKKFLWAAKERRRKSVTATGALARTGQEGFFLVEED